MKMRPSPTYTLLPFRHHLHAAVEALRRYDACGAQQVGSQQPLAGHLTLRLYPQRLCKSCCRRADCPHLGSSGGGRLLLVLGVPRRRAPPPQQKTSQGRKNNRGVDTHVRL
jgi:hypothetical protein